MTLAGAFLFSSNQSSVQLIMRTWSVFGALSAVGGLTLANADVIQASNFNVTEGLAQLGVDVSSIPALQSFSGIQARSTEGACAAAVSLKHLMKAESAVLFTGSDCMTSSVQAWASCLALKNSMRKTRPSTTTSPLPSGPSSRNKFSLIVSFGPR